MFDLSSKIILVYSFFDTLRILKSIFSINQ